MDIDEAYNVGLEIVQSHEGPAEDPQSQDHVPSSNVELIKPIDVEDSNPMQDTEHYQAQSSSPQLAAPDDDDDSPAEELEALNPASVEKRGIAVIVPAVQNPWEYLVYEEPRVREVLEEFDDGSNIKYLVEFEDGREDVISFEDLVFHDGETCLTTFQKGSVEESASGSSVREESRTRLRPRRIQQHSKSSAIKLSSEDELIVVKPTKSMAQKRRLLRGPKTTVNGRKSLLSLVSGSDSEDSGLSRERRRPPARVRPKRESRNATRTKIDYTDLAGLEDDVDDNDDSANLVRLGKRKRSSAQKRSQIKPRRLLRGPRRPDPSLSEEEDHEGIRRSSRNATRRSMREIGEDEIPDKVMASDTVKYVGAKESFRRLADDDDFLLRHCQTCDACGEPEDSVSKGVLICCQGCSLSYHQKCLGFRNSREHLVTKIAKNDFVLQCRRCIGLSKQKDPLAPDQGECFSCHEPGASTTGFRDRKSTKEEQKEREENDGEDPITEVLPDLINNPHNVLFRCMLCYRAYHMHHLPPKSGSILPDHLDEEELAAKRFAEYHLIWSCKDCSDAPGTVDGLVAWRPTNIEMYEPGTPADEVAEDLKEYLVKWKRQAYFTVQWKPGAWVWGVVAAAMRKAFAKRDNNNNLPKMTTEEAVHEDYLRIDIVFDVEYTNVLTKQKEDWAKARIKEVKRVLVKFKGLGYEDAVWTEPPHQQDTERWKDFKSAYEYWVMGAYIREPVPKELRVRLAQARVQDFGKQLELKTQPENMVGGEMMEYQLEGLNWLYYQWFKEKNAILADEMGLGKTIQVIGFLAALKQSHSCWPFLIVVPNSTGPNWRREIKQWAPSLRVITYYGSAEARRLAAKYELFPSGNRNLGCHVVVTSYDAAQDDNFRKVFRGVRWAGLVVDEGQRLKNDKNILYGALNALKPPFKLLLTGTPLQNNARELFNLLQFLDTSVNAQKMEEKYTDLTKENVAELHDQLRKVFLRRTKAEVLKFLPPLAQIILPVSMSVLQKKLYKSILAKNPELIKSIMSSSKKALGKQERTSLNNILMQLRKCLCHPYVYSKDIEDRNTNQVASHRNLVDASSKLQLLEIMLPKLQERGHRVLIFSQFLDMLDMVEDFLDGLGLFHERLDGSVGSLDKQKKIDAFNAPDSQLFAFLLSTRAGGVGINLATADTVIILDPDFNPHQDIQALSRAHRIGQEKKVLVFQLTTRATAEEKIMQIGKKKMALDHVLIEQMDAEDEAGKDIESILRHGTEALFKDDDSQEIKYDSASVDKLLDRSQIENTQAGIDHSAESQFSFAKVWVNAKGSLEEGMGDDSDAAQPDPSIWDAILREREREAAEEAATKEIVFGRGRRKRQTVDYSGQGERPPGLSPAGRKLVNGKKSRYSDSDTDFQEESGEEVPSADENSPEEAAQELQDAQLSQLQKSRGVISSQASQFSPTEDKNRTFKRAQVSPSVYRSPVQDSKPTGSVVNSFDGAANVCIACHEMHPVRYCKLKAMGTEICNLCGLAHFGFARTCPHLNSVTQLRAMHEAIKISSEPQELKDLAKKKVTGIIGDLNQRRRRKEAEIARNEAEMQAIKEGHSLPPVTGRPHPQGLPPHPPLGIINGRVNGMGPGSGAPYNYGKQRP